MSDYRRFELSRGTWKIYEPKPSKTKYEYCLEDAYYPIEEWEGIECGGLEYGCRGCFLCGEECHCSECFGFNYNHIVIIKL